MRKVGSLHREDRAPAWPRSLQIILDIMLSSKMRIGAGFRFLNPDQSYGARVWGLNFRLSTAVLDEAAREMEGLGLEAKEFFVLDGVDEEPFPAGLARRLTMSKPALALHLRNLEGKALITRKIDSEDHRRHRLELTSKGRQAVNLARNILTARYGARLERLEEHERVEFGRLLQKLVD
jgi:DNA-binding MarR family transcriptional regulator